MEKRPPTENVVHLLGPMTRCFAIAQTQWRGEEAGLNRELIGPKIFFPVLLALAIFLLARSC